MEKRSVGAVGGAAAGYFLWKKSPFIGAILGFFVGRMVGTKLDEKAALPATTEQGGVEVVEET